MNCLTDECWNLKEDRVKGKLFCTKLGIEVTNMIDLIQECEDYSPIEGCPTCRYHDAYVYESGFLDGIEYSCSLQDDKAIYHDVKPLDSNYAGIPKCPINRWVP